MNNPSKIVLSCFIDLLFAITVSFVFPTFFLGPHHRLYKQPQLFYLWITISSISFIFLPNIYQIFFFVYHSIRQSKLHKDKSYSLFYHHITKTQTLARINQHHCFLFILLERLSAPLSVLLLPPHSFPVTRLTFIKSTRAHYRFVVSKLFMFP